MPANIFNEGRVVGYSAYEVYVRHVLSEDPNNVPASEIEWLSSSIAMGSSMLLKISAETRESVSGHHIINVPLPTNSNLAAANTIIGSLFLGDAEVDSDGWATKVTSYGPLIENNATNPTVGDHSADTTIPPTTYTAPLSAEYQDRLLNYVKVVDGIVVQPGTWLANEQPDQPPHKDFKPDLSKRPFVKIYVSDTITEDFYLLLTGFTLRAVLEGVSGLDGSTKTDSNYHDNGGFLGPAVFPWANKIVFSIPPAYVNYFLDKRYERAIKNKLGSDSPESFQSPIDVKSIPIIDMESTDPATYYESNITRKFRTYQELTSRPTDWSTKYTSYFKKGSTDYIAVTGQTAPDATGEWPTNKYYKRATPSIGLNIIDANTTNGDRVLTVYQRNDLLPPALYATKVDSEGDNALHPVDTVAPGTVKLFEDDTDGTTAKTLENEIPGNRAFIRNSKDYVLRELNENQNIVPVAEVSTIELDDPLRFEDLTPPFFMVDGSARPDTEETASGQEGDLEYAKVTVITLKRITGRLSSKVEAQCGYSYDSSAFKTDGVWENANKVLMNQIDSENQDSYYYIVNASSPGGSPYVCPVRKSDHVIDITIPYETGIYVDGTQWYPVCTNRAWQTTPVRPNSMVLGSATAGSNLNDDGTLAGVPTPPSTTPVPAYDVGFGYIIGTEHPTRKTRLADVSGQIDNPTAILPADDPQDGTPFEQYYADDSLAWWFDESYLSAEGIDPIYEDYTIDEFLRVALYTDVGTTQPLDKDNPNISQTLSFCANTATSQQVDVVLEFTLSNSEENSGVPQYLPLPKNLSDKSSYALGVHTQTGNKESICLSVADSNLKLYDFQGNGGNNIIPGDGNLHWDDLLDALANNKSIDLFSTARFVRELGLKLSAGLGISINWDPKLHKYVITNTMPYNPSGQGYTRLYQSNANEQLPSVNYNHGGFDCISYNGWRSVDGSLATSHHKFWGDETFDYGTASPYADHPTKHVDINGDPTGSTITEDTYFTTHLNLHSSATDNNGGATRPVPRVGTRILPAMHMDYKQIVCVSAPADWDECWKYYYYELVGDEYVDLATSGRQLLEEEPDDWEDGYFNYYTYDEEMNKCSFIPVSSLGAPTWEPDKYYTSTKPTWQGDTFTPVTAEPSDWETYEWYNNSKYYVKIQTSPVRYAIYPRALLNGSAYPNWESGVYYTRESTAKYYVGYPDTVSTMLSGDTSYTSPVRNKKTYNYQLALPPKLPYVTKDGDWTDGSTSGGSVAVGSICKGFYKVSGATFKHNDPITDAVGQRSILFGIKFTGQYAYLNHTQDMISYTGKLEGSELSDLHVNNNLVYNLTTSTSGTSGIWNVDRVHNNHYLPSVTEDGNTLIKRFFDLQSFDAIHQLDPYVSSASTTTDVWTTVKDGAAWAATCNLYPGPVNGYALSTFIVSAAAYADGYNDQMSRWSGPDLTYTDEEQRPVTVHMNGLNLTSLFTNLNITGLFYLT